MMVDDRRRLSRRRVMQVSGLGLGAALGAASAAEAPLRLKGSTTALVVVDLQKGSADAPLKPISFADVAHRANMLARFVRDSGGLVVFTHVLEREVLDLPADSPLPAPQAPPPGADALVEAAGFVEGDVLVAKRQWGAFYATDLDQQLRRRGIETLLIAGVATELGVESTVRAAYDQGYALVFAEDALSGMSEASNRLFLRELFPRMGRVRTVQQIADALRA